MRGLFTLPVRVNNDRLLGPYATRGRRMRCVHCGAPCDAVVTLFSKTNYVLKECSVCHDLLDPYIDLDFSQKLVDVLLLKKRVFRHWLFNASDPNALPSELVRHPSAADGQQHALEASAGRTPSAWRLGPALILLQSCKAHKLDSFSVLQHLLASSLD